jgi:pimeloyl-ACP methyl ester carboxylesterase
MEGTVNEVSALAELGTEVADRVVTTTVRDMHRAIADRAFSTIGPTAAPVRLVHDGIASSVYGLIRRATVGAGTLAAAAARSAGGGGDVRLLSNSARGNLALAAINGLLGDELDEKGSDLCIDMSVRHQGRDLPAERDAFAAGYPDATGRVAVFLHGLMETDDAWRTDEERAGGTYASRLRVDLGYTPVQVRYNTGLHVSENGRRLSQLLDAVVAAWPTAVEELVIIGHSMGGLVCRSACHYAGEHGSSWLGRLRHVVFLGTPHTGAPLEKAVNAAAWLLGVSPESRPFANILNTRSSGIKDLRFGYLCEDDWSDCHPDALLRNTGRRIPLPIGVDHHAVYATVTVSAGHPVGFAVGDLLVRASSASGTSFELGPAHVRHIGGVHHFALLNHPGVYEQLCLWLGES